MKVRTLYRRLAFGVTGWASFPPTSRTLSSVPTYSLSRSAQKWQLSHPLSVCFVAVPDARLCRCADGLDDDGCCLLLDRVGKRLGLLACMASENGMLLIMTNMMLLAVILRSLFLSDMYDGNRSQSVHITTVVQSIPAQSYACPTDLELQDLVKDTLRMSLILDFQMHAVSRC